MFVYIIGILAQFEQEQISERTINGIMEKANQGQYPFRDSPFGYEKLENHELIIDEKESNILRKVFELYVYKFQSEAYINNYLYMHGSKLKVKGVTEKLMNPVYQGYVTVPRTSDNRYYICESIFSTKEIEDLCKRKRYIIRRYGYKHDYKYRNKVFINGIPAKHTKKIKNGEMYHYYFVKGYPYVNENLISKFLENEMKNKSNQIFKQTEEKYMI